MVKTKVKYECEVCGKVLKNARALAGHRWFAHGKAGGKKEDLQDKIKLLEREKGVTPDTVGKIDKISKKIDGINPATPEEVKEISEKLDELMQKISNLIQALKEISKKGNPDDEEEQESIWDKWFL